MVVAVAVFLASGASAAGSGETALSCEVLTARNGREALDSLQGRDFDIVLMDCQRPEPDGYLCRPFTLQQLRVVLSWTCQTAILTSTTMRTTA